MENKKHVTVSLHDYEHEARNVACGICIVEKLFPEEDITNQLALHAKRMATVWDLPIEHLDRKAFYELCNLPEFSEKLPSDDYALGNFESIPCIVIRDNDGDAIAYIGFRYPEKCLSCTNRQPYGKVRENRKCIPSLYCAKCGNGYCGLLFQGCTAYKKSSKAPTEEEKVRAEWAMWKEILEQGITVAEWMKKHPYQFV